MVLDPYPPDLQPTIYIDPRTIYNQAVDAYAPSDTLQTNPRATPTVPSTQYPTTGAEGPPGATAYPPPQQVLVQQQRAYALATKTSQSMVAGQFAPRRSYGGFRDDVPVGNIVYQSLQRPKLLRGGEWQLSMITNLIAAAFLILTIMQWNIRMLPGAIFFGIPMQWLLRRLAAHDPKYWRKYMRYVRYPLRRMAHGRPDESAPVPAILPPHSVFIH